MSANKPSLLTLNRRSFLAATGATAGLLAAPGIVRAATDKLTVSVGRIPWAAGNAPMTAYMIENKLFEKYAAELGYELTVDWRDYPTAMPQVEAFVADDLDMGMWGNTPIIRSIAAGLPLSLMCVGEGRLRFMIVTREGRGIRKPEDLKGKTIGSLLGGDPYNALSQMLRWELGSADPRELGINLVNVPVLSQAAAVPTGLDAAIAIQPMYLAAAKQGTKAIWNSYGYTEDFYDGPLGTGAGIEIPSVKNSPFYPEGYYIHRSFWVLRNSLAEKHPNVVVAFMAAQQEAVATLSAQDPGEVSQLVKDYWKLEPTDGAKVVNDDLIFSRGWSWPTNAEARAVQQASQYLVDGGVIEQPLGWDQVKGAFELTAPLAKQAFELLGSKTAASEFTRTDVNDLRGLPLWNMDQWTEKSA